MIYLIIILYIAALIFALAFAALVIFVIASLNPILKEVRDTLAVLRQEVNNITVEVTQLLHKTNNLVEDLEGKSAKLDSVFDGIDTIGHTLNDLIETLSRISSKLTHTVKKEDEKIAQAIKWGSALLKLRKK